MLNGSFSSMLPFPSLTELVMYAFHTVLPEDHVALDQKI